MSTTTPYQAAPRLSEDEIAVIAEHERLHVSAAAKLGDSLLASEAGVGQIKRFLLDNVEAATQRGHFDEASRLALLYRRFDSNHSRNDGHES